MLRFRKLNTYERRIYCCTPRVSHRPTSRMRSRAHHHQAQLALLLQSSHIATSCCARRLGALVCIARCGGPHSVRRPHSVRPRASLSPTALTATTTACAILSVRGGPLDARRPSRCAAALLSARWLFSLHGGPLPARRPSLCGSPLPARRP